MAKRKITIDHPSIQQAIAAGLVTVTGGPPIEPAGSARRKPEPQKVVEAEYAGNGVFVLPIRTVSEANARAWKEKSARTRTARAAVSRLLGRHLDKLVRYAGLYHQGRPLHVQFVRLGGKRLDAANLPSSLKATEDAVALMLGADDGSPLWRSTFHQDTSHPLAGVRVTLSESAIPTPTEGQE